jgi:4-hydroxy-2-oxoheptanedioate aldolase
MRELKPRLAGGEQLIGVLLRMPAEELVEMAAVAGFDFVLVDCEHGPADVTTLRQHIAVAAVHQTPVLVRVGQQEPALVLRVLDAGAEGIVAPHVDTADQARALVASAHYPPLGQRGFATYGRTGRFGLVGPAEHQRSAADRTLVIGMIESPVGVANAAEIFAVPGLDGAMIGPADLRMSSTAEDLSVAEASARVHENLAERGGLRMDIVNGADQARQSQATGAQLVVYNLTHTIMELLTGLRRVGEREAP